MIIDKIKADFLDARKSRDKTKSEFYSWIIGMIQNTATSKDMPDNEVLPILQNMNKKLVDVKEYDEAAIVASYLPKQLTENEIREILSQVDGGMKEKMSFLKENYPSQYDGKMASQIAKE